MSQQWWYFTNGERQGPITSSQLQQLANHGKITPETPVITNGLPKPVAASRIKGLFKALSEPQGSGSPSSSQTDDHHWQPPTVAPAAVESKPQRTWIPTNPAMLFAYSLLYILAISAVAFIAGHSRSRHRAKVAAADARATQAISNANAWIAGESEFDPTSIENMLSEVIADQVTTKGKVAQDTLAQVQKRREQLAEQELIEQADQVLAQARRQIKANQVANAIALLQQHIDNPWVSKRDRDIAQQLRDEAKVALSESATRTALEAMTDEQLAAAGISLEIPDGKVTDLALKTVRGEIIRRLALAESQRRQEMKAAAEQRIEAERLAAMELQEARQAAEEEAKRLQDELVQAEKADAAQAAAQAAAKRAQDAARTQAWAEKVLAEATKEHNDKVKANMIRWWDRLLPSEQAKYASAMEAVVLCSQAMESLTKDELTEVFQIILDRPDGRAMEEFIYRSGIGELEVKVKADGKSRSFDEAWTYGVSLVIKGGRRGK